MREVGGSIQRIDIPAVFGGPLRPAAFFGDDGVRGKVRAQPLHHQRLGRAVGFGDQVEFAFQLEADVALEIMPCSSALRLRGRFPRMLGMLGLAESAHLPALRTDI